MITDQELKKIRELMPPKAFDEIAAETGFSKSYVYKVLSGTKYNLTVISLASKMANHLKLELAELKEKINQL